MTTTTQSHIPAQPPASSSSQLVVRPRFQLPLAILMVMVAYTAASGAENEQRRQRTVGIWREYMFQGVSAYYDDARAEHAASESPAIFVRNKAPHLFFLNGTWTADGSLTSFVPAQTARLELYQMKLTKCYPSIFECAPGAIRYDFFLLRRVPGSRPEVLRTWLNLQKNMTGYDPAHERYVPDVRVSMSYDDRTHELRVSIDNIQQPLTDALQLDL